MPVHKLVSFLDDHHVEYLTINHSPAYTAQEIAAAAHVPGKEVAKAVIVKVAGRMTMLVLPASCRVDLPRLRRALGVDDIELADEEEFRTCFSGCEVGAMPPFGNLYGMEVWVDERLREDKTIVFNAGSHTELMRLAYADFEHLVHPRVMRFSV